MTELSPLCSQEALICHRRSKRDPLHLPLLRNEEFLNLRNGGREKRFRRGICEKGLFVLLLFNPKTHLFMINFDPGTPVLEKLVTLFQTSRHFLSVRPFADPAANYSSHTRCLNLLLAARHRSRCEK